MKKLFVVLSGVSTSLWGGYLIYLYITRRRLVAQENNPEFEYIRLHGGPEDRVED